MFYTNERSPKKVVEIIESIDGALLFKSKEKLEKVMASINFKDAVVMNPNLKLSRPLGQIRSLYTGMIHNQTVYLTFSQYAGCSDIKLLAKQYSTLNSRYIDGNTHRDNDLPAITQYFSDTGNLCYMAYYKNNVQIREGNKPIFISHYELDDGNKHLRYYKYGDYSAENFSIYSVDLIENKIIDATFCYNNSRVLLAEMIEIIPEIKSLRLQELKDLKNNSLITSEIRTILDMSKI